MVNRIISGVCCLLLIVVAAGAAWSQGAPIGPPPSAGGYHSPSQPTAPPMGQAQPGWTPPVPAYQPPPGAPAPQVGQGYPSYPYPPHHNPYYDGSPPANFLSQWFDYVFNLPNAIVGRVADFMDRRVFPASPATHGNQSGAPVPQTAAPSGPPPPLPPASVYEQTRQ